jgi:hypothetical protein
MSNEFKGTPGPWRFHSAPPQKNVPTLTGSEHYGEEYVAVVGANSEVVCDNAHYYSQSVSREDALLIAAAPELLAALQEMYRHGVQAFGEDFEVMLEAKAVIDKATSNSN